ncbi:MAG: hypothetical protein PWQ17_1098 [Anaerophaga sp.]|nr:hypothetical protein [Anaerophaga sp.]
MFGENNLVKNFKLLISFKWKERKKSLGFLGKKDKKVFNRH